MACFSTSDCAVGYSCLAGTCVKNSSINAQPCIPSATIPRLRVPGASSRPAGTGGCGGAGATDCRFATCGQGSRTAASETDCCGQGSYVDEQGVTQCGSPPAGGGSFGCNPRCTEYFQTTGETLEGCFSGSECGNCQDCNLSYTDPVTGAETFECENKDSSQAPCSCPRGMRRRPLRKMPGRWDLRTGLRYL